MKGEMMRYLLSSFIGGVVAFLACLYLIDFEAEIDISEMPIPTLVTE